MRPVVLFEQSIHERDIPGVMKAVFRVAPYILWKKRWQEWDDQERSNPFLRDYLDTQFRIERAFEVTYHHYLAHHKVPRLDPDSYELFSFLALLVKVHERLSEKGRTRLAGSMRDALRNSVGLVPVEIELRVATHLMRKGFDVDFVDLEQRERFDLLASKNGMEIEVDCKSVSADVGRRISRPALSGFRWASRHVCSAACWTGRRLPRSYHHPRPLAWRHSGSGGSDKFCNIRCTEG